MLKEKRFRQFTRFANSYTDGKVVGTFLLTCSAFIAIFIFDGDVPRDPHRALRRKTFNEPFKDHTHEDGDFVMAGLTVSATAAELLAEFLGNRLGRSEFLSQPSEDGLGSGENFFGLAFLLLGLLPGTASHGAAPSDGETPARKANVDGGSMIVNNIISDFGHGDSHWIWDPNRHTCAPERAAALIDS